MPPSQKNNSSVWVWSGLAVLAALAIFFYMRGSAREVVAVRVASPTHQNLMRTVATNGKVEPIDEFQAHAPFSGVVQRIYVHVGQRVKPGEMLISMADADARSRLAGATTVLRAAELSNEDVLRGGSQEERITVAADLKRSQLQVQQMEKELGALQALQQKGAASASEVESARQRLEVARTSLQQTQQRMNDRFGPADRAHAAALLADAKTSLDAANGNLGAIDIRAPFAGTVYSLPVTQFDFVPGGDDLLDVADLNRLQIRAYFDEPEIGQLAAGQPVKIAWDAKPNESWQGRISLAPTTVITYNTRSVGECIISIDDAKGELLPNTNVTVTVTTSQRNNVLSIPREALHTEGLTNFVYRVVDRRLVRTPVQIGVVTLNSVEITGGLSEKDRVALGATTNRDLVDGLEVRPVS